jgi:Fe-S-cluster formation regulator IscX/YfhJ
LADATTTINKRIAVLIDAENVSYKLIDEILDEVALHGRATNKRIYGDFTSSQLKGWNGIANEYSLHQVTQLSYTNGKNSSDSVLIINAMDILFSGNVEAICIVSSDSDFTRLAMRVVESGLDVIGMGEEKTAESFINACTVFKFLGAKQEKTDGASVRSKQKKTGREEPEKKHLQAPKKVIMAIRNAIINLDTDNDGWIQISLIGDMLHNRFSDFDPRIWGAKSTQLSSFLMQLDEFEVEAREGKQPNAPNYYIRIR